MANLDLAMRPPRPSLKVVDPLVLHYDQYVRTMWSSLAAFCSTALAEFNMSAVSDQSFRGWKRGEAAMSRIAPMIALGMFAALAMATTSSAQTTSTQTPAAQPTAPIFDMKGTWTGMGEAIMDGAPMFHPQGAAGEKPAGAYRMRDVPFTYKIVGQDGLRFWGTVSTDVVKDERLIGSLSHNGKTIYMAGKVGLLDGEVIDANTIEMCYRHVDATSALVNCKVMKRAK
jgi:hypothetical protein